MMVGPLPVLVTFLSSGISVTVNVPVPVLLTVTLSAGPSTVVGPLPGVVTVLSLVTSVTLDGVALILTMVTSPAGALTVSPLESVMTKSLVTRAPLVSVAETRMVNGEAASVGGLPLKLSALESKLSHEGKALGADPSHVWAVKVSSSSWSTSVNEVAAKMYGVMAPAKVWFRLTSGVTTTGTSLLPLMVTVRVWST